MGFNILRPPTEEKIFDKNGIITEVWNKFYTEIVGIEQFRSLEGIVAGTIKVGDSIASTDYVAGTTGWRIATDAGVGVAEFNIPIVSYANVSGTKPPIDADKTSTIISGGLVTTGRVEVAQGGTVSAGITGETSGDTSVRFWAGSSFANRTTAPFRVLQSGVVYMTGAVIDSTSTLNGTATSTVVSNASTGAAAATTVNGWKYSSTTYIDGGDIYTGTITTDQIAANTITSGDIANATITATNIANGTVTGTKIANGTITTTQIAANTIVAGNIAAGTITATEIAAGTITATQLNSALSYTGRIEVLNASSVTGAGMTGGGSASTDVRIWAGDTYANRATAPFRITHDGKAYITGTLQFASTGFLQFVNTTNYLYGSSVLISIVVGSYSYLTVHDTLGVTINGNGGATLRAYGSGKNVIIECGSYSSDTAGIIGFDSNGSRFMFAKTAGLFPNTNDTQYIGYAGSFHWKAVYATGFYDNGGGYNDLHDDLAILAEFKPKKLKEVDVDTGEEIIVSKINKDSGAEYLDIHSLPDWLTNKNEIRKKLKDENGDLISDEDIEEWILDDDEAGWLVSRNKSAYDDLTNGAVRQLDIEMKEVFELLMGRITQLEKQIKEVK